MPIPNSPGRHPSLDAGVALSPSLSSQLVFPSTIALCAVFFDVSSRILVASLERSSLFTILLQQSLYRHLSLTFLAIIFAIGVLQVEVVLVAHVESYILHITLTGLLSVGIYAYLAPVWADVSYMRVRWAAWSGMSRTGIAPRLVKYLPQVKDGWEGMAREKAVSTHPVDKVIVPLWLFGSFARRRRGISADPTALLVAAQSKNEPIPQADVSISSEISIAKYTRPSPPETAGIQLQGYPVNVYRPLRPSKPVSLLWGEQIFFSRRASRGIISLPRHLLSSYPMLSSGVPAHGLVLAFGMLARNKGLTPNTLVCNLMYLTSLRIFEEYSARYPRPAKTLRSYFRVEMEAAFGALGTSYVTAATELAVILSDTPHSLILEWLGQNLEHQDLLLNVRAQELGATDEDLDRLYRGSYAAMLVSLNTYTGGKAIRPEILVFEGLCRREQVDLPEWARGHEMHERRRLEVQYCGGEEVVGQLVNTVV